MTVSVIVWLRISHISLKVFFRSVGILYWVVGVKFVSPELNVCLSIYTNPDTQVSLRLERFERHLYIFELRVGSLPISVIPSFGFGVDRVCVRVCEGVSPWCFVSILVQPIRNTRESHFLVIPHICYDCRQSLLVTGI